MIDDEEKGSFDKARATTETSDEDLPTKTFRRRPSDEDLPTKIKEKKNNEDDKEKGRVTNTKIHRRRRAADKSHNGDELKQLKKKTTLRNTLLGCT